MATDYTHYTVTLKGYTFEGDTLIAENHEGDLGEGFDGCIELLADDGDVHFRFEEGTTKRDILFFLAGFDYCAKEQKGNHKEAQAKIRQALSLLEQS